MPPTACVTRLPTYRLPRVTVTAQTLYVYADDFPVRDGTRNARVRFTYHKDGDASDKLGVMTFDITQRGYISFYLDDSHPDAGLYILNEDGTPSNVKRKTVVERFHEYRIMMNPGIPARVQYTGGVVGIPPGPVCMTSRIFSVMVNI